MYESLVGVVETTPALERLIKKHNDFIEENDWEDLPDSMVKRLERYGFEPGEPIHVEDGHAIAFLSMAEDIPKMYHLSEEHVIAVKDIPKYIKYIGIDWR